MFEHIIFIVVIFILIYLSVVDIKYKVVPVCGNIAIISIGIFTMLFDLEAVKFHLTGGIVLFIMSLAIAMFSDGLGGGDVKLMGGLGLIFGSMKGIFILGGAFFFASIFALFYRLVYPRREIKEIPFVPFITFSLCLIFIKKTLYL